MNPYLPPQTTAENRRENCPICGVRVGYLRFTLPLGHCRECGNYLTIRNWGRSRWFAALVIATVTLGPFTWRQLGYDAFDFPTFRLLMTWFILRWGYNRVVGKLVPAICWGFLAIPDDDRIEKAVT